MHLTPSGASYTATAETLLKGKPLNLTDVEFGKDGAMYFITGGRGTQSGLYRVSYVGEPVKESPKTKGELALEKTAADARALRHKLESFHGRPNPKAVDFAWPYLDSEDRFIRYAARIAIESQPVAEWADRALSETRTNAGINGLLALARCGGKETQGLLLHALAKFPLGGLTEAQQLDKLRVIELEFHPAGPAGTGAGADGDGKAGPPLSGVPRMAEPRVVRTPDLFARAGRGGKNAGAAGRRAHAGRTDSLHFSPAHADQWLDAAAARGVF